MRIPHLIPALACVMLTGYTAPLRAAPSVDPGGRSAEEIRVSTGLLSVARDMWSLIPAICEENGRGLLLECAHQDESFLATRKLFSRTSTFKDVTQYLGENGFGCSLTGSSMVIRSKHLDGVARNPLDTPFPPEAFEGKAKELQSRIVDFCVDQGVIVSTGGTKGSVERDTVFSFSRGECKTLREVLLGIARRGGSVVTVLTLGTSDTAPATLYLIIN